MTSRYLTWTISTPKKKKLLVITFRRQELQVNFQIELDRVYGEKHVQSLVCLQNLPCTLRYFISSINILFIMFHQSRVSYLSSQQFILFRDTNKEDEECMCKRCITRAMNNPDKALNSVSKIDKISRIVFPLAFTLLNVFYWYSYLSHSERISGLTFQAWKNEINFSIFLFFVKLIYLCMH